jgi:tetratricopeptide (TPR) repeat protein
MSYNAKKMGDHKARIAAIEWTANRPKIKNSETMYAETLIDLAEIYIDIGEFKTAQSALKAADDIAKIYGNDKRRARIYRFYGILYSKVGNKKKTEKMFQESLKFVGKAQDSTLLGRIQVSSGIAYHQRGAFYEAKIMLDAGLESLPERHPDRLTAYAHLAATAMKTKDNPCATKEKELLFGFHGIAASRGFKGGQYEVSIQINESGIPEVLASIIYKNLNEDRIDVAEKELQRVSDSDTGLYRIEEVPSIMIFNNGEL